MLYKKIRYVTFDFRVKKKGLLPPVMSKQWLLMLVVIFLGGCNMQNRFLYFPNDERPTEAMLAAENMAFWPKAGADYRGFVSAGDAPAPSGTIVLFHGNGGTAFDRVFYRDPLANLGFRILLAEYPQYGGRPGKVGEKPFVADGLETVRLAYEQYGEPLYLLGESLGCGVAAAVAKQTTVPVSGIILITPWDTLASVAKSLFPFLPVKLVLTDKYDSIENLSKFPRNIAVVGAEHDEILPIKHAHNLYANLPEGKKRMWVIRGAGHNDWPYYANDSLWKEMTDFVKVRPE
ncbi:MAG TPA: alpha/beta hydrolase [Syntrophaceae bacterium]|jgi:pimeloyl-ACP methyl ester carboxylesterase|nr:alpha/beta hydrolase [Syntrophaceae bacterium]HCS76603.1 alpha/beta hydrolase [Syntrophaceae bacterium]HCX01635.1 alpha/beta hydrolase [Syntrophaceae bacterium]